MSVRVLVVDDSGFFRRRVIEILNEHPQLEVIGSAANGEEAIAQTLKLSPDVITMDIEMPVMNGIDATRKIMESKPTPIIMFSSLTTDGAKYTLDALEAGAVDFLPKRFEDISSDREEAKKLLCSRVASIASHPVKKTVPTLTRPARKNIVSPEKNERTKTISEPAPALRRKVAKETVDLLAIGTSTGGPVALQEVLAKLPENFPVPILIVQHMPASFTPSFAQRLNTNCAIHVKEASDGDVIKKGTAYLAPGGKQMLLVKKGATKQIKIIEAESNQTYKPSVDITYQSILDVYPSTTLAVILTGMGADGREGAKKLNEAGSKIWAQDEASCVVYGMPAAVTEAGIVERVFSLDDIGNHIVQRV